MRTVTGHSRSSCSSLPHERVTILMIHLLIEDTTEVLSAFLSNDGILNTLIPETIVEVNLKLDFAKAMISFSSYDLVHESTTNTMKPRLAPSIALKRSKNTGGHYFMSLYSGKRAHGYKWEVLPVD